jgi:hypothetical protein
VYLDYKNLTTFTNTKELNKQQIKQAKFLSEFNFKIIYYKGLENGKVNALSSSLNYEQIVLPKT